MSKWPVWLKVVVISAGIAAVVAFAQVLLYFDRMGVSKFDL